MYITSKVFKYLPPRSTTRNLAPVSKDPSFEPFPVVRFCISKHLQHNAAASGSSASVNLS